VKHEPLKPCPFCGSDDVELEVSATERTGGVTWYAAKVACHLCRCKTGFWDDTVKATAVELAIQTWNRRASK
jgi:Lar family restriction alleviation protein